MANNSTSVNNVERTETSVLQKVLPTNNELVQGFSAQGTIADVVNISKVELRLSINARIKDRTKLLKQAQEKLAKSVHDRDVQATQIEVPKEFYKDLAACVKPMLKFHPGAYVDKRQDEDDETPSPAGRGKNFISSQSLDYDRKLMTAQGTIKDPQRGTIYTATRQYDLPKEMTALNDTVKADQAAIAGYQGDLVKLRDALANLDSEMEAMQAAVHRQALSQTSSGQNALAAMAEIVNASLANLDGDMSGQTATPPNARKA